MYTDAEHPTSHSFFNKLLNSKPQNSFWKFKTNSQAFQNYLLILFWIRNELTASFWNLTKNLRTQQIWLLIIDLGLTNFNFALISQLNCVMKSYNPTCLAILIMNHTHKLNLTYWFTILMQIWAILTKSSIKTKNNYLPVLI